MKVCPSPLQYLIVVQAAPVPDSLFVLSLLERADFCNVGSAVQALMAIKNLLEDPQGVLKNWDTLSVDPCSWNLVTCSPENLVTRL
jgi:hypothetical protein